VLEDGGFNLLLPNSLFRIKLAILSLPNKALIELRQLEFGETFLVIEIKEDSFLASK